MDWDDFEPMFKALGIVGIVFGFFAWAYIAFLYSIHNIHLNVFVEEKLVYDGRSACVEVSSGGATTQIDINGGWYCLFPKEHYTSKNVRVETIK